MILFQIVELLLDRTEPKKLYEALLLAISLDHDEIAEVILKHPIYEKLEKQENALNQSGRVCLNLYLCGNIVILHITHHWYQ